MSEIVFFFIWATPILLNISRESFLILFTYAPKPIPNAQIENEVFTSGAPLYIVSVTAVILYYFGDIILVIHWI